MSKSKRTRGDIQFILPKEGSSISLLKEDPSKVTKIIDLQIEDFLERLNKAVEKRLVNENFLESPKFILGDQQVSVNVSLTFNEDDEYCIWVDVYNHGSGRYCDLRSILVTGNCGNLGLENKEDADDAGEECEILSVELGSVEELKEAMTTTGNPKLDLQVTVTAMVTEDTGDRDEDKWSSRKKPRLSAKTMMANISEDVDFTDFSLESEDGAKFPVHRNVLAVQSSVLRRMFLIPMKERKTGSLHLQYKADIVRKFVKFFYERKIQEEEEKVETLGCFLELAEKYDLPHLKVEVEELAMRTLSVENMVDMFLLADLFSAQDLKTAAKSFIRTNRLKVKENLAELNQLERNQAMKIVRICIV